MTSWTEEPLDVAPAEAPEAGPEEVAEAAAPDRRATWQAGLLGVLYAGLVLTAAFAPVVAVCVLVVVVLAGEAWLGRRPPVARSLRRAQLAPGVRAAGRAALLVAAVAAGTGAGVWALLAFALAAVAVVGARSAWLFLARRARRNLRKRVHWQGLDVGGVHAGPATVSRPGFLGRQSTDENGVLLLEWLLVAGAAVTAVSDREVALWVAAALSAAGVLVFLVRALRFELLSRRAPSSSVLPAVVAALHELAPEVVCYFSSPASGSYALRVWVDTLRCLRNRVVVVLREAHHLDAVDLTGLAVVVLPLARDVEAAQVPSMRVALYPTNVIKNNHMIRLPGIRHAFIGHGDSDKAGSFSPVTRMYDEIWVAGEAGRDRYLTAREGVRPEQVRQVSRPQLAPLAGRRSVAREQDSLPTVLYAPTWEGFYEQSDYCSVARPGVAAVRALVDSGRFRVLFKPHPASGGRRADVRLGVQEIEDLLTGGPHQRVPDAPEALYSAMCEADVLLSDVSSVLSDWLATGRPYVVANPQGWAVADMHERFPTTCGGAVLDPDGAVLPLVAEALGVDALADRRARLSRYLLGTPSADPLQDFVDEVSAFVDRAAPPRQDHEALHTLGARS